MTEEAALTTNRWVAAGAFLLIVVFCSLPIAAQDVNIDISACSGMYAVLEAMHDGAARDKVSGMLDKLLETPAYQVMFRHYNRSWRPNHLPVPVFKRMILSLQFEGEYVAGENQRADQMRARWSRYYPDLSLYESQMHQLEAADLPKLIHDGVRYAQTWLPPGWQVPAFNLIVVPNGGSPAFTIEDTQGYDFLQLSHEQPGQIDLNWLVGTVAHESHHLGMRSTAPPGLSVADAMAYRVVTLCIPEGVATEFISGPPAGHAPAVPGVPWHVLTPDLVKSWNEHVAGEEDIVKHQVTLLDKATAGALTDEAFNQELRDYWLNGAIGRAYVLGSDMFGAIYTAFGKQGVFSAIQDPRHLFELYNAALDAKPDALKHCVRVPEKAVKQALAIGNHAAPSQATKTQ